MLLFNSVGNVALSVIDLRHYISVNSIPKPKGYK